MIFLWMAFTLGLTGSLHCMGMCGPLALGVCSKSANTSNQLISNILVYNIGRILTYFILGIIIGLFSHLIVIGGAQKIISIVAGAFLVFFALSSSNIDHLLTNNKLIKGVSNYTLKINTFVYKRFGIPNALVMGILNGLLPCGLVYLALAGALTTGSALSGGLFMLFFGLGTVPLLAVSVYFGNNLKKHFPTLYQKVLPTMTGILGIMMILRGILINMPLSLNFFDALKNPILCH